MKTKTRNRRFLAGLATVLGAAVLAAGPAAAVASAAPAQDRASVAVSQTQAVGTESLKNISIGTHLRLYNKSNETITVDIQGNKKVHETVHPGDYIEVQGNALSDDDISGPITFSDGSRLPVYAHNPEFKESYVQVGGHKWHGSGGHTVEGKMFHADWDGNWKDPNGDIWKDWRLTYVGRG